MPPLHRHAGAAKPPSTKTTMPVVETKSLPAREKSITRWGILPERTRTHNQTAPTPASSRPWMPLHRPISKRHPIRIIHEKPPGLARLHRRSRGYLGGIRIQRGDMPRVWKMTQSSEECPTRRLLATKSTQNVACPRIRFETSGMPKPDGRSVSLCARSRNLASAYRPFLYGLLVNSKLTTWLPGLTS